MLDVEIQNIIENCKGDLKELLCKYDYIIRERIFTGEEVLEILDLYPEVREHNELSELKDKHKKLRDNVKKLAIRYSRLKDEIDIKHDEKLEKKIEYGVDEKIEAIKNELKRYKGEFVNNLLRKISEI